MQNIFSRASPKKCTAQSSNVHCKQHSRNELQVIFTEYHLSIAVYFMRSKIQSYQGTKQDYLNKNAEANEATSSLEGLLKRKRLLRN